MKIFKSFQLIYDLIRGKKYLKIKVLDNEKKAHEKRLKKAVIRLKDKLKNGEKLKVYFFVIYDACFPAAPVFEKMLESAEFEPFVVAIPDTSRGFVNMQYQLDKSYKALLNKYGGGGGLKVKFR